MKKRSSRGMMILLLLLGSQGFAEAGEYRGPEDPAAVRAAQEAIMRLGPEHWSVAIRGKVLEIIGWENLPIKAVEAKTRGENTQIKVEQKKEEKGSESHGVMKAAQEVVKRVAPEHGAVAIKGKKSEIAAFKNLPVKAPETKIGGENTQIEAEKREENTAENSRAIEAAQEAVMRLGPERGALAIRGRVVEIISWENLPIKAVEVKTRGGNTQIKAEQKEENGSESLRVVQAAQEAVRRLGPGRGAIPIRGERVEIASFNSRGIEKAKTLIESKNIRIKKQYIQIEKRKAAVNRVLADLGAKRVGKRVQVSLSGDVLFDFDKWNIKREAEWTLYRLVTAI
jgi:outer membrane protein OmpA-like peptidoglycan-associated protein